MTNPVPELTALYDSMVLIDARIDNLCKGCRVRIVSKFNGQEFGRSKPPLTGKEFTVTHAFYDNRGITLWLDMDRYVYSNNAVGLDDVEFI